VKSGSKTGEVIAIKIIELEQFPDSTVDEIRKEILIMSTNNHKNVVSYYKSFSDLSEIWLVMPLY
jgi:serine/threonine protein kinase